MFNKGEKFHAYISLAKSYESVIFERVASQILSS